MKIGILTLPLHTNYGGILQAWALQTILKNMGHEVHVLDKSPYKVLAIEDKIKQYSIRFIKKYVFRRNIEIFKENNFNRLYPELSKNTQIFIEEYIDRLEVNNLSELPKNSFDALVVGSDQIWRPKYYKNIKDSYFDFAKTWDVLRISYAPSFATDDWEYSLEQTEICGKLLSRFDAISVRESSAIELCKAKFNCEAVHVLDPTMLLSINDYVQLINKANTPKSNGNLLNYILDETTDKVKLIESVSNEKSLVSFRVNAKINDFNSKVKDRVQPPIEQWLRGFYDAEFVVTDSFHACVFSILFNKPFIVVGNRSRGMARFESLLKLFKLEDRLVTSQEEYQLKGVSEINWNTVNSVLESMKEKSFNFLSDNLK